MRTFDFSPFARNAIGFETLFDRLNDRSHENTETYPPYDIVRKGEDEFQINLALAGFSPDEITITAEASELTVAGKKSENGHGRVPVPRDLGTPIRAALQSRRLPRGPRRLVRQRAPAYQSCAAGAGSYEAPANSHRQRHSAWPRNRKGGLSI